MDIVFWFLFLTICNVLHLHQSTTVRIIATVTVMSVDTEAVSFCSLLTAHQCSFSQGARLSKAQLKFTTLMQETVADSVCLWMSLADLKHSLSIYEYWLDIVIKVYISSKMSFKHIWQSELIGVILCYSFWRCLPRRYVRKIHVYPCKLSCYSYVI